MIKVFNSKQEYNRFIDGGLVAGDLYYVISDGSVHFRTNNIDGIDRVFDKGDGGSSEAVLIEGSFTANGTYEPTGADGYSSVEVNVPIPSGYIQPSGTKSITANGTGIDVTQYASVDVAVPASGITPTGNYNITANGNYDITNYASVSVNVAAPAPSYTWHTLTGNNLEMNIGTTYIFKTNVAGVYMWHGGIDTDGSGTIDNIDDEPYSLGQMVANTEYYFTALNGYAGADDVTHSYMVFAGDAYSYETALPTGAVIQYAIIS